MTLKNELHEQREQPRSNIEQQEVGSIEERVARLFTTIDTLSIIRILGALLLIASASTFLVQQVADANDLIRYGALIGHTLLLGAAGIFCALKLSEGRSARTFFAIVLASVPVHFSVLGGLLYSQFQWDSAVQSWQPSIWTAPSATAALTALGVGVAVLLPLTLFSMMSLARKHARTLTGSFLLMNSLLLLPVRFPNAAIWVVFSGWTLVVLLERFVFSKPTTLKTVEGRILRAIMAVPVALVLGRTVYFYSGSLWFYSLLGTGTLIFFFVLARQLPAGAKWVQTALAPLVVVGAMVWLGSSLDVLSAMAGYGTENVTLRVSGFWLLVSGTIVLLGAGYQGRKQSYYRVGLLVAMVSGLIHMVAMPSLLPTAIAIFVPVAGIWPAVHYQQKITFAASVSALLLAVGFHIRDMIQLSSVSHWGVLLFAGVLLIVGASVVDRKRDKILLRVRTLKLAFESWGY
ncbi:MAG: hypothetical protein JXR45_07225 [Deltaproteobacteria bacterium]|nr:hypothetical protein [Deltaproteobacteria bacterium]